MAVVTAPMGDEDEDDGNGDATAWMRLLLLSSPREKWRADLHSSFWPI